MKKFKIERSHMANKFNCSRCNRKKKSKNIAKNVHNKDELLCKGY